MTIIGVEGWEGGVFGAGKYTSSGTFSIQSTVSHTGTYALRVNPTTSNTGWARYGGLSTFGAGDDGSFGGYATMYGSFWFRADTLPSSLKEQFVGVYNENPGRKLICYLSSAGLISVHDQSDTLVATGTTALVVGTWYLISIRSGNGTSATYEVKINGTTELTGTCNQTALNCCGFTFGKVSDVNSKTIDFYYDDFILSDTAYPNVSAIVIGMGPTANGSTMQWTSGTGASDYTQVAIPGDSGTTYVKCGTGGSQVALFGLADPVTIGSTIYAYSAEISLREDVVSTTSTFLRIRSASTNSDSSPQNFASSYFGVGRILETDPATTAAWTLAGVYAAEVGAVETNAVSSRLDFAYAQVACLAPSSASPPSDGIFQPSPSGQGQGLGLGLLSRLPT